MDQSIFKKLSENHILNDIGFHIWIYDIKNIIVQNNRYLRLFFFNRLFDSEQTNQIIISFHGKEYELRNFQTITEFGDSNIFGCNVRVPIEQDDLAVSVERQIVEGKTYTKTGQMTEYVFPTGVSTEKTEILKECFSDYMIYPSISDLYYQCDCGRIIEQGRNCPCGKEVVDLNKIFEFDYEEYTIGKFLKENVFNEKCAEKFDDALAGYSKLFSDRYPKYSTEKLIEKLNIEKTKKELYDRGLQMLNGNTMESVQKADEIFSFLDRYEEAAQKSEECKTILISLKKEEKEHLKKLKRQKTLKIVLAAFAVLTMILLTIFVIVPANKYKDAGELMNKGQYDEAIAVFTELDDYKDSKEQILECNYLKAHDLFDQREYETARDIFSSIKDYKDSDTMIKECDYQSALVKYEEKDWKNAFYLFRKVEDYRSSKSYLSKCNDAFVESFKKNVKIDYSSLLSSTDDYNPIPASKYVTINDVRYTIEGDSITFTISVSTTRKLQASFFDPPNVSLFMKIRSLNKGNNTYSNALPLSTFKKAGYFVSCKYYDDQAGISGFISFDLTSKMNQKDLYGDRIFGY